MKWFKKAVARWSREGERLLDSTHVISYEKEQAVSKKSHRGLNVISGSENAPRTLDASGMTFTLYKSVGGFILETHRYDSRTDRKVNELYMINEDEDFAKQVAQAIMMESMKI